VEENLIATTRTPRSVAASLVAACLLGLAAVPAGAQSENVNLLSTFDPSGFAYADMWGYDAGGTEIAILMDNDGTYFVNVTDPGNPVQVGFIDGVNSTWRDAKTYDQYCYIVNEDGGGLQIVSLVDPLNPTLVGNFTAQFTTAHNVWIDTELGLLFAVGSDFPSNETNVYDLDGDIIGGASPTNPGWIFNFTSYYVHDMYSQDGVAYLGAVYDGLLVTADLTQLPGSMPVLGTIPTDDNFTHNVWTSEDGAYAFTTDETGGGHVTVIDVSDPANMVRVGEYVHPDDPGSIIHNVAVKGDLLYAAWYRAGLEVVDISVPSSPQRIGYYDTSPASGSGFNGAWGVYPFAPSGAIYISDMESGLFVLELAGNFGFVDGTVTDQDTTLPIEGVTVTALGSGATTTTDENGFYHLVAVEGADTLEFDNFFYFSDQSAVNVTGGAVTVTDIALEPRPTGSLGGTITDVNTTLPIPGADVVVDATPLSSTTAGDGTYGFDPIPADAYSIAADAFGYAPGTTAANVTEGNAAIANVALTPALVADDIESDQGWTVGAAGDGATTGIWTRVDPRGTAAQPEDDHTNAPGVTCWVTGQGPVGGGVGDNDVDGGQTTLLSPIYDLSGQSDVGISYFRWYVNDAGSNPGEDPFTVDVTTNGLTWTNIETILTSNASWEQVSVTLSDLGLTPTSQVQLRFIAIDAGFGGSIVEAAIDDLEIFGTSPTVAVDPSISIGVTRLLPLAPNPFRSDALVRFELAGRADVSLDVYDVQGRLVQRLVDGSLDAGVQAVRWDGRTLSGASAAPGVYYVRLETKAATSVQKIVRAR
jgi:choice-of-anchor B domain-containing protein